MLSASDFHVTYTPGTGYSAKPADRPDANASIGWGEEMQAALKELLAKQMTTARQDAETFERTKLTDAEIAELARKYNPQHMTQNEYDQFLENLAEKGALSKVEMGYLGYGGRMLVSVTDGYFEDCTGFSTAQIFKADHGNLFGVCGLDGNVLSWSKLMSVRTAGTDHSAKYEAILDVLKRMER